MRRWLLCGVALVGNGARGGRGRHAGFPARLATPSSPCPAVTRWDGFYVGGHVGWSVPGLDFGRDTDMVEAVVRMGGATSVTSSPLGNNDSTATHFGGFVGYQQQWDGAVVGLEGTYNWLDKSVTATNAMSGSFGSAGQRPDLFGGRLGDGAHHRLRHDSHEGRLGGEQLLHALCDLRRCDRPHGHHARRADHANGECGDAARVRRARALHGRAKC